MPRFKLECVSYRRLEDGTLEDDPMDHILPRFLWERVLAPTEEGRKQRRLLDEKMERARRIYNVFCALAEAKGGKACLVLDQSHQICYITFTGLPPYDDLRPVEQLTMKMAMEMVDCLINPDLAGGDSIVCEMQVYASLRC